MYPCACAGVPNFKFSRRVCTLPSCGRLSPSSVTISLIKAVSACGRTSGTSIGVGRAAYIVSTVSRLLQRLPTSQVNYFHLHLNLQVQPSRAPRAMHNQVHQQVGARQRRRGRERRPQHSKPREWLAGPVQHRQQTAAAVHALQATHRCSCILPGLIGGLTW